MNIPDNHICGRCGASLPLVFDEEGKVFHLRDPQVSAGRGTGRFSPGNARWVLRFGIILFALLLASWIMHHR
jgi:hypothetical protein